MKKTILLLLTLIFCAGVNAQTVLSNWGFESITISGTPGTTPTITPATANSGVLTTGSTVSGFHTSSSTAWITTNTGNGSAKSLSSNNWAVGDYYQFQFATTNYANLKISFEQTGSNTGPRDFKVQYSTNGSSFTDLTGGTYTLIASNWTPGSYVTGHNKMFDLSALTVLNNLSSVYIRLVCNSTVSINATTVAGTGTGRIDSFRVLGTYCPALKLATSSKSGLTSQCAIGSVQYYGDGTDNYFAIDTSGITSGALTGDTVSITVGNFDSSKSSNGSNQEHAMYLLNRYWNAKGSFTPGTVKVQFPYDPADTVTLVGFRDNAYTALLVSNSLSFAKKNAKLEWFKTVGADYGASVISGIVGNKFPVSAGIIKPTFTYGTAGSTNYVVLDSITGFSGGSAGFSYGPNNGSGGNGLPVTWVSIDAGHTETGNRVDWSTASEKNNDYFLVESSSDAITWKVESSKIEPNDTSGYSASLTSYNWIHTGNNENRYYRVKQVDRDGKYDYSKIVYANKSASGILSGGSQVIAIYPNPSNGQFTVETNSIEPAEIVVTNMLGKRVFTKHISHGDIIDLRETLPCGVYLTQIGEEKIKLIIQ